MLFAGAGVATRAGLPSWGKLLARLMEHVRAKDPLTAAQMGEKIRQGNLPAAAEYFFLSDQILAGDKHRYLTEELSKFDPQPLLGLASLPFRAYLTTNFDRSLVTAVSRNRSVMDYRYGDQSFSEAIWQKGTYIARIHGSVEAPRSIVLTSSQFERLLEDRAYRDLLSYIFTRQNVLFLGFSFYDPAIRSVLDQLNRDYGAAPPGRHVAFLPEGIAHEFLERLRRLNIDPVFYAPDDDHRAMWESIDGYTTRSLPAEPIAGGNTVAPFATARRFLAACYSRARLGVHLTPLREVIVEGMVAELLQRHLPKGVRIRTLVDSLHEELAISRGDAKALVDKGVATLRSENMCRLHKEGREKTVVWIGEKSSQRGFDESIAVLVQSARNRAVVQEGWHTTRDVENSLQTFFKELVLQRGWDLGAAFAAKRTPEEVDIAKALHGACVLLSSAEIDRLQRVCESILTHPSEEEATVLSELGRVSFALELAVQSPRTILFHATVLPERIYLDANVLMPALTPGHPFNSIYSATIDRLREAAARAAVGLQLLASRGFLNEIVSHKRLALRFVEEEGPGFLEAVRREALYHGATNVNVFVGAYSNLNLREPTLTFSEFLQRYVPYTNEMELSQWLKQKGIAVVPERDLLGSEYPGISLALQKAYSAGLASGKEMWLIEHDAYQLSGLAKDRAAGRRVILVTADKGLREAVRNSAYSQLGENMVSHVGLTQMIDLLIGLPRETRGLTGLIWGARVSQKTEALRAYLIALGLEKYDEALAMEMPSVVERIAEEMNDALVRAHLDPESQDPSVRAKAFKMMGGYEKGFFEGMKDTIERRQRQERGPEAK